MWKAVAIAQSFHAVVSHFSWSGDFAAAKNFALSQSGCDWNLVLDADADFHFACGSFYMRMILSDIQKYMNYLPLIEKSYLRCLEIGEVPEHQGTYGCGSFKAEYNLGVWYEVSGNVEKAGACYRHCADCGYEKAAERLQQLNL